MDISILENPQGQIALNNFHNVFYNSLKFQIKVNKHEIKIK